MTDIEKMIDNILPLLPELYEFTIAEIFQKAGDSAYATIKYPNLLKSQEKEMIGKIEHYLINKEYVVKKVESGRLLLTQKGADLKSDNSISNYLRKIRNQELLQKSISRLTLINSIIAIFAGVASILSTYMAYKTTEISQKTYEHQIYQDSVTKEKTIVCKCYQSPSAKDTGNKENEHKIK